MDLDEIKAHWENWASSYGTSLRATTKASTPKFVELGALTRTLRALVNSGVMVESVLEVGCGNGENCLHLAKTFENIRFTGVDYVADMIDAAKARRDEAGLSESRLELFKADVLDLPESLASSYDLIFTDRCLINLNTDELQCQALSNVCERVAPGGHLLMIENNIQTYDRQNALRGLVGLEPRTPATFNHFFDETVILPYLENACAMEVLDVQDFISLHDLVLYVLIPAVNGGEVDYDHPMVEVAARLSVAMGVAEPNAFGAFGQNRLYLCRKAG